MISIITVTFNNFNQLKETLSSIPQKNYIESVVINGGSCEETKEFLKNHWGKSITEKDKGISDAFNKGVKLSEGDIVMFINSGDVLIDEKYLEYVDRAFSENPDIDYVCCDIVFDDNDIGKYVPKFGLDRFNNLAKGMPFPHPGLAVRKKMFDKIGYFDLSLKIGMDFDFICRMSKLNPKGLYYKNPVILMDGSGVSSADQSKVLEEMRKILEVNGLLNSDAKLEMSLRSLKIKIKKIIPKKLFSSIKKKIITRSIT